jgi:membrane-bound ClpP family serine protease
VPSWIEIDKEVRSAPSALDAVRQKYLRRLHKLTGRNVLAYYSGWLQKPDAPFYWTSVGDDDKNGFMAALHGLDRGKGLDLILHTPGGDVAATESLVEYLHQMFPRGGAGLRAIVPQLAMSAGTMIALGCEVIVLGKHSSLGPIDPQVGGRPAGAFIEEFDRAHEECRDDPARLALWQLIISKYPPAFLFECEKALEWSRAMVRDWLAARMFHAEPQAADLAEQVTAALVDHSRTLSHARHIGLAALQEMGLAVVALEADDRLQEAVLSVHHAMVQTLGSTGAAKIVENHLGVATITMLHSTVNR